MKKIFSPKRIIQKIIAGLWITTMMFALIGCNQSGEMPRTEISILKDGSVSIFIAEPFEASYYDEEELQQSILMEAASYNRVAGSGNITVEKIEVANQVANVIMKYAKASDYAAFNDCVFFIGSAAQAQDEGYDIDKVFSAVSDEQKTIGISDMLAMEDYKILITDSEYQINLYNKAGYISDNVVVSKSGKTIIRNDESDELIYILFQ